MPSFSIGHFDHDRAEVTLVGPPADPKTNDFDWVTANVEIMVGGFTGRAQIYMCASDMIRFRDELDPLYKTLTGCAEFKTIENQFYVRIETDGLGHMRAAGFLIDKFDAGNKLTFEIDFDQTLLFHTLSEINDALFELSSSTTA
jgi:hypothetical protein